MGKQSRIPGTMDPKHEIVHDAAEEYIAKRDLRQAALKEEVDAADVLLRAMTDADLDAYSHGGIQVTITKGKDKPKVTQSEEDPNE